MDSSQAPALLAIYLSFSIKLPMPEQALGVLPAASTGHSTDIVRALSPQLRKENTGAVPQHLIQQEHQGVHMVRPRLSLHLG